MESLLECQKYRLLLAQIFEDFANDTSPKCPYCDRDIAASNFAVHKSRCRNYYTRCELCNQAMLKTDRLSHELYHDKITCPVCGAVIERRQVGDHLVSECPERALSCENCKEKYKAKNKTDHSCLLECEFCEDQVRANKMFEHIQTCLSASKTEKCPQCQKYVQRKHLTEHVRKHFEGGRCPPIQPLAFFH